MLKKNSRREHLFLQNKSGTLNKQTNKHGLLALVGMADNMLKHKQAQWSIVMCEPNYSNWALSHLKAHSIRA